MTIAVTGATGALGRLVIDALLARQTEQDLVAVVRDAGKAADLAERGVEVRVADYSDPDALAKAFVGVDRLLLISSNEVGRRFEQHRNVIDAAKSVGIPFVAYTSITQADTSVNPLAPDHKQTEEYLAASGLGHAFLRDNWYHENYLAQVPVAAQTGVLLGAAGDGLVASAARRDYAEGAAVVLSTPGHEGKTYEFTGDTAWTYDELAAALTEVTGREVSYQRTDVAGLTKALQEAGLDEGTAGFVAALDQSIADGSLALVDPTLSQLIGRPTTPLVESLKG